MERRDGDTPLMRCRWGWVATHALALANAFFHLFSDTDYSCEVATLEFICPGINKVGTLGTV